MKSNKEIREDYKQRKFKIGVFQVRNKVNDKIFIGSSVNLDAMWNRIKSELKFGTHRNEELQREWNQFGEENFHYEILSEIEQKDGENSDYGREARKLEEMFIDDLKPFGERGYHQVKL